MERMHFTAAIPLLAISTWNYEVLISVAVTATRTRRLRYVFRFSAGYSSFCQHENRSLKALVDNTEYNLHYILIVSPKREKCEKKSQLYVFR